MLKKYKQQILELIFKVLDNNNCIVFLFGSYATNEKVHSSDIDIGIVCNKPIRANIFLGLQERINEEIPLLRDFDIVDFSNIDNKVKKEALKEIKIWHTGKNCQELLKSLS